MNPFQHLVDANIQRINACVARAAEVSGRQSKDVTLVAVTKTQPAEAIRAAYEAGVRHFGENRVQEREEKLSQLADLDATWHFVGHLQSNKAARATALFQFIDSIDDAGLARRIARAIPEGHRYPVLLEMKLDLKESKFGLAADKISGVADAVISEPKLELRGLMGIAPVVNEPDQARPFFRQLREMRDALERRYNLPLPALSMGMSHDFEIAIEEGATQVRLGTALFGARRYA